METILRDEKRAHQRFHVKRRTSFVLNPEWPSMGEVVDISYGGFAFNYESHDKWPAVEGNSSVIFGDHDSCMTDLPVQIVADFAVGNESAPTSSVARRCCVKFGKLNDEQKFLLECFIWINGVNEC